MASGVNSDARTRRLDFCVTMLFGAVYASALFLIVTSFAVESSGCGGRFYSPCPGETYWRIGAGFSLIAVAPVLSKVVPNIPFEQGVGRASAITAMVLGALAGIALTLAVIAAVA
ncbi:hypothetical protein [Streptomyces sp. YS415]|uniref:hypothetical protein n=1 Tax=Streptomyces sp. YS415 TaxID=2944806 RepID=UPI002020FE07|nr:hypothetical protein [Streptomyces sp. YS415]MCL7424862.1 hypothetical protein [Streptomyces sp. YS415]